MYIGQRVQWLGGRVTHVWKIHRTNTPRKKDSVGRFYKISKHINANIDIVTTLNGTQSLAYIVDP